MPTPASFPFIFGIFKQTIQFLKQINVTKCPFSIEQWNSNPQLFVYESSPITTRPGLPPNFVELFISKFNNKNTWALGSGGGSVGRAVASNFRGPLFESNHQQKFTLNIYCQIIYCEIIQKLYVKKKVRYLTLPTFVEENTNSTGKNCHKLLHLSTGGLLVLLRQTVKAGIVKNYR